MRWRRCCAGAGARTGAPGGQQPVFDKALALIDRHIQSAQLRRNGWRPSWGSLRSLYRLFARRGLVVAQYIRNRRLDLCAQALRSAAGQESWPASASTGVSPITAISRPLSSSVSDVAERVPPAISISQARAGPASSIADADRFGFGVGIQPIRPKSRPLPDCLNPPNGMFGSISVWVLTHTVPA